MVEVMIAASLFAVIGLALVGSFTSGMKIWNKVYRGNLQEQIGIFFDKTTVDFHNVFYYKSIQFSGDDKKVIFPTLVSTYSLNPGLKKGVGQISLYWDKDSQQIMQEIKNLSNIYTQKQGVVKILLKNVENLVFNYYYYNKDEKKYAWVNKWQPKDNVLPLAISIAVSINYENKLYTFNKAIFFPVAG